MKNNYNIYKMTLVSATMALSIALTGCTADKPSDVENPTQSSTVENEVTSNQSFSQYIEGAIKYESIEKLYEEYFKHWKEKLGTDTVYCGDYGTDNEEEISEGITKKIIWTAYFTVDENLMPCVYQTKHVCFCLDEEIYVTESTDYDFSKFDQSQIMELKTYYWMKTGEIIGLWEDTPYGVSEYNQAQWIKNNAPLVYEKLQDPVTAFETWLHIEEKGKATFISTGIDEGFIEYECSQGEMVKSLMHRENDVYVINCFGDDNFEEAIDKYKTINKYLSEVTAKRLISESKDINDYSYEEELKDEYYLIKEFEDKDVAFYGLTGSEGMVLRIKDKVYPYVDYWDNGGYSWLEFYIDDYDGDGQDEYAVVECAGRGTGYSTESLRIFEVNGDNLNINSVDNALEDIQLARITDSYDENSGEVSMKIDGALATSFVIPKELFDEENVYECFEFGSIMGYQIENGKIYMWADGGLKYTNRAQPDYELSVEVISSVSYKADGSFEFGDVAINEIKNDMSQE